MSYEETIKTLFELLKLANSADSDNCQPWQQSIDANQRAGFFGKIYDSIQAIAGTEIIRHWCETGEVDCTLATR